MACKDKATKQPNWISQMPNISAKLKFAHQKIKYAAKTSDEQAYIPANTVGNR